MDDLVQRLRSLAEQFDVAPRAIRIDVIQNLARGAADKIEHQRKQLRSYADELERERLTSRAEIEQLRWLIEEARMIATVVEPVISPIERPELVETCNIWLAHYDEVTGNE